MRNRKEWIQMRDRHISMQVKRWDVRCTMLRDFSAGNGRKDLITWWSLMSTLTGSEWEKKREKETKKKNKMVGDMAGRVFGRNMIKKRPVTFFYFARWCWLEYRLRLSHSEKNGSTHDGIKEADLKGKAEIRSTTWNCSRNYVFLGGGEEDSVMISMYPW